MKYFVYFVVIGLFIMSYIMINEGATEIKAEKSRTNAQLEQVFIK